MTINSHYIVICTDKISESRDFYIRHFGFEITFESDWYVSLRLSQPPHFELALLDYRHETIPTGYRTPTSGVILNFEVEDVDRVHDRITQAGLPVIRSLRSEAFGQRHFITRDPNNLLIDVITNIPPSEAYAAQYKSQM
ncbi:glyoxalase/bleomycin resistance/extradiol dioxygenase family protein [Anaerolineae bacterium CFX9]|jgi:catechol 2,3-dioxygenase-like lactoylglutathione lyase family enzyme|nr:glyoxalase/bleomycin resistance/extradiol dioxygenase family protein [Anaerolineae bacterium CFX9]